MSRKMVVFSSGGNLKAMAQRGARAVKPSASLTGELVHLHHHAVDLVGQALAELEGLGAEVVNLFGRQAQLDVGIHVKARRAQPLEQLPLTCRLQRRVVRQSVHERRQVAHGGDAGVFLTQRPCGRVARVGERGASGLARRLVERVEAALGHVDLAAQLDRPLAHGFERLGAQPQRHVPHRSNVGGHVLAGGAVAARRRTRQRSVLIRERDGRSVDLQLAAHRGHGAAGLHDALDPRVELAEIHRVVERVHPTGVAHGANCSPTYPPHALSRARRIDELRVRRLELAKLAHEGVERGVGYLGGVEGVVQVGVALDLAAERF